MTCCYDLLNTRASPCDFIFRWRLEYLSWIRVSTNISPTDLVSKETWIIFNIGPKKLLIGRHDFEEYLRKYIKACSPNHYAFCNSLGKFVFSRTMASLKIVFTSWWDFLTVTRIFSRELLFFHFDLFLLFTNSMHHFFLCRLKLILW